MFLKLVWCAHLAFSTGCFIFSPGFLRVCNIPALAGFGAATYQDDELFAIAPKVNSIARTSIAFA
jgi:hypothetical protein